MKVIDLCLGRVGGEERTELQIHLSGYNFMLMLVLYNVGLVYLSYQFSYTNCILFETTIQRKNLICLGHTLLQLLNSSFLVTQNLTAVNACKS